RQEDRKSNNRQERQEPTAPDSSKGAARAATAPDSSKGAARAATASDTLKGAASNATIIAGGRTFTGGEQFNAVASSILDVQDPQSLTPFQQSQSVSFLYTDAAGDFVIHWHLKHRFYLSGVDLETVVSFDSVRWGPAPTGKGTAYAARARSISARRRGRPLAAALLRVASARVPRSLMSWNWHTATAEEGSSLRSRESQPGSSLMSRIISGLQQSSPRSRESQPGMSLMSRIKESRVATGYEPYESQSGIQPTTELLKESRVATGYEPYELQSGYATA
ncbi:hypothetical protein THAOC_28629, partial [Thalassiosira oceanica]